MTPAQSGAMSDHLVRVGHLKNLQRAHGWDDSELARRCGRKPQQVWAWFNNTRHIGERLARSIEEKLELRRYALDDRPAILATGEAPPDWGTSKATGSAVTRKVREVPIIRWAEIKQMLDVENASLKTKALHLESYAPGSSRVKFIEMPDDSMAPDFAPGDHVLLDPVEAPRAGDVVLVSLPSGEHFIRFFRPRTAYVFDAVPMNRNYLPLSSTDDGAVVSAVMVEHRRYRHNR